jgi:hypothetical protein
MSRSSRGRLPPAALRDPLLDASDLQHIEGGVREDRNARSEASREARVLRREEERARYISWQQVEDARLTQRAGSWPPWRNFNTSASGLSEAPLSNRASRKCLLNSRVYGHAVA